MVTDQDDCSARGRTKLFNDREHIISWSETELSRAPLHTEKSNKVHTTVQCQKYTTAVGEIYNLVHTKWVVPIENLYEQEVHAFIL